MTADKILTLQKINILLLFVNIILYLLAPMAFSMPLCIVALGIFLINVHMFFKNICVIRLDYFNILFTVSFFGCNFLYPCFIFAIDAFYFNVFIFLSTDETITKATLLASLGYTAYISGYLFFVKKLSSDINIKKEYRYVVSRVCITTLMFSNIIFLVLFLLTAGDAFFQGEFDSLEGICIYFDILYRFTFFVLIIFLFYRNRDNLRGEVFAFVKHINKVVLLFGIIYIALGLHAGERGVAIQFILLLFLLFELYVKHISKTIIFTSAILGALTMNLIAQTRGESNPVLDNPYKTTDISLPFFDVAMDFVVNNVTIIESFNYVNEKGYTYGKSLLGSVLQVVPFSQSVVFSIFNIDFKETASSQLMTDYIFGNINKEPTYGLGTNMNADLYIVGGPFFLIFIMTLFGYNIAKLSYNALQRKDLLAIILYAQFFVLAIYLPRTSLFILFQPLVWSFLLYKIMTKRLLYGSK